MKLKDNVIALLITIILGVFILFVSTKGEALVSPLDVFRVYLNGKTIGYIESKDELLSIIDDKQNEIKNKYNIDKVHPPTGLKIEKVSTYNDNISSALNIYQIIEKNEPFTIDGYTITIKYTEDNKKPIYIYTLKKEYFEDAFYNTISAFVGAEALDNYKNNTQLDIKDQGERIESIYWDEDVTIKKSLISVKENIFTSSEDLSKYLLFGTTEKQKSYIVREGDNLESIIQ